MTYRITILPTALRQLAELPRLDQRRIKESVDRLAGDPRPAGVKRLQGMRGFLRLRSGNYRIIYAVEDDRRMVLIIRIGHRRDVYRRL